MEAGVSNYPKEGINGVEATSTLEQNIFSKEGMSKKMFAWIIQSIKYVSWRNSASIDQMVRE